MESGTERSTTRRDVLKFLRMITVGLSARAITHQSHHPNKQRTSGHNHITEHNMTKPLAYLALPGVSFTSLLANLPSIVNQAASHPTILIDTHDYNRFRGRVTLEKGNSKVQHLGMIYAEMLRRGDIQPIDYREYYPEQKQEEIIRQNRAVLDAATEDVNRDAAMQSAYGWVEYGRGAYQEPFRTGIGEDSDRFADSRQKINRQHDRMDRGTGDPVGWNERVLNQYIAALVIRENIDRALDFEVRYIIGQGESPSIETFHNADAEVPSTGRFLHTDIEKIKKTRKVLDRISEIATKKAGVQHNDWVLGPTLTIPRFDDISEFNFRRVRRQARHNLDVDTLWAETNKALAVFDERTVEGPPSLHVQYDAERIVEDADLTPQQSREILTQMGHAIDLSNYSPELRELIDANEISQAAVFLAASIKSDPLRRYTDNAAYRQCVNFLKQFELSSVTPHQIENFRNRGSFRRQGDASKGKDWYQLVDRPPIDEFSIPNIQR
jgi:hypothetical protein